MSEGMEHLKGCPLSNPGAIYWGLPECKCRKLLAEQIAALQAENERLRKLCGEARRIPNVKEQHIFEGRVWKKAEIQTELDNLLARFEDASRGVKGE